MKKLAIGGGIFMVAHLYLGYYVSMEIEDPRVDVQKPPTLQVRCETIHNSDM
jgi:hypothetical protein